MGWENRYRSVGDIGGAKFFLKSYRYSGGQRVEVLKFPQSDRIDYRRHGKDNSSLSLTCFVVGNGSLIEGDYDILRDKLFAVLEEGGTKKIVHPYLGTLLVEISNFSLSEEDSETNIANFTIELFVKPSGYNNTEVPLITIGEVGVEADKVKADTAQAIKAVLDSEVEAIKNPSSRAISSETSLLERLGKILLAPADLFIKGLDQVLEAVKIIDNVKGTVKKLNAYKKILADINNLVTNVFTDIGELYEAVMQLLDIGFNPFGQNPVPSPQWTEAMISTVEITNIRHTIFGVDVSSDNTAKNYASAPIQTIWGNSILLALELNAFASYCSLSAVMEGSSRQDILNQIEFVKTKGALLLFDCNDDKMYLSMRQLISKTHQLLLQRIGGSSKNIVRVLKEDSNSILLTYEQFGNLDNYDNFLTLNTVEDPSYIVEGTTINFMEGSKL